MNHIDSPYISFESDVIVIHDEKPSIQATTTSAADGSILPPPRKLNHKQPRRVRTKEEKIEMAALERLRYHNLPIEKKKEKNQRRAEAQKQKKEMIDKLLATPVSECTPEMLEILKKYMIQQHRKSENARNRYANMTPDERRLYNNKRQENYKKKKCLNEEEK